MKKSLVVILSTMLFLAFSPAVWTDEEEVANCPTPLEMQNADWSQFVHSDHNKLVIGNVSYFMNPNIRPKTSRILRNKNFRVTEEEVSFNKGVIVERGQKNEPSTIDCEYNVIVRETSDLSAFFDGVIRLKIEGYLQGEWLGNQCVGDPTDCKFNLE